MVLAVAVVDVEEVDVVDVVVDEVVVVEVFGRGMWRYTMTKNSTGHSSGFA